MHKQNRYAFTFLRKIKTYNVRNFSLIAFYLNFQRQNKIIVRTRVDKAVVLFHQDFDTERDKYGRIITERAKREQRERERENRDQDRDRGRDRER